MGRGTTKNITASVKNPGRKVATASTSTLEVQWEEARQSLLKAKGMRSQYSGHLDRDRRFLRDVVEQKCKAHTDSTSAQSLAPECDSDEDIETYSHAFDPIPNRYSAPALELFLVQKGLTEGRGISTTWGVFSAFKDLWWNVKGETFRRPYHCNEVTGVVTGNPALSAAVQDMMEILKNNEGAEGGTRNHASAMTIEDMQKLMSWSYDQCPDKLVSQIYQCLRTGEVLDIADVVLAQHHLMVRAFSTTGFTTIWTRNFELTKIKHRDIVWNCQGRPPYGIPFDLVSLLNRKGWQQKGETDGALEGHKYEVYAQPHTPEICTNGVVYPTDELSYDAVMKMLTWICTEAALASRYTSHCFRRGGARYCFMFVPLGQRWSLATIRWWGAWAEGESVDTLIRYLLDELTRYEKNHCDALCPIPREAERSFNGDHILTAPVTAAETRELKMSFDHQLDSLSGKVGAVLDKLALASVSPSCCSSLSPSPSLEIPSSRTPSPANSLSIPPLSATPSSQSNRVEVAGPPLASSLPAIPPAHARNTHGGAGKAAPIPGVGIPDLPRGPDAWRAAVKQWEDPAASIGGKALKDWPEDWYSGAMCTITGVKCNMRKVIALEFNRMGRDESAFLVAYPEASRGAKPLFDMIQRKREERGELIGRKSKNGHPKDRVTSATIPSSGTLS
ncbi:uncharacterized protein F5891DRAFT_984589 [Suillus fuscotomentosus]|uniref:Uncharacterized protein n=1 Tax=Suillus fuscotomentosus TaxID=1912939 RepID=A0AAD4HEU2_9AGAM|nr:uncharacterized protein F5891DRAFT_984589 [Suillus fuscotomentosus]KAG1895005.1 hypothetical protein F5891DRAFT_984589 [Suillus fuscotomentosus]